jgi:hypothetical protein
MVSYIGLILDTAVQKAATQAGIYVAFVYGNNAKLDPKA